MRRTLIALAAVGSVGVAAVALGARRRDVTENRASASRTVSVRRGADELYAMWRDPAHLPLFIRGLRVIEVNSDGMQRWTVGNAQRSRVLQVALVRDMAGRLLEWRTVGRGPFVLQAGLALTPLLARDATEVRLSIALMGPGAGLASAVARPFGASVAQVAQESLRDFKALAEAGEIPQAVRN